MPNSAICGLDNKRTFLPDWLINVTLLKVTPNSDQRSFAVPDASIVTAVFPLNLGLDCGFARTASCQRDCSDHNNEKQSQGFKGSKSAQQGQLHTGTPLRL
jgi:hypothetical protein